MDLKELTEIQMEKRKEIQTLAEMKKRMESHTLSLAAVSLRQLDPGL